LQVSAAKSAVLHRTVYRWPFPKGATKIAPVRLLAVILCLVLAATAAILWRPFKLMSSSPPPSPTGEPSNLVDAPAAQLTIPTPLAPAPTLVPPEPEGSTMGTPLPDSVDRVAFARGRHGESIKRHCAEAGVDYPPRQLFLRAFKHESEVEAWGSDRDEPMKLIKTWPLTARSGVLGPKRREGDRQIPEGCYRVVIFNPKSNFHLSLGLDYPNAADLVHSDKEKPGFDIYIHGSDRSIGCLAVGDDMIEELYLLAEDFRSAHRIAIPVHIFPARMEGNGWDELRQQYPQHVNFWAELESIYKAFETAKLVPKVKVNDAGAYELEK